jgi:putative MATE family efflux protein
VRPSVSAALADIVPLSLPILAEQALIVSMTAINAAMASNVGKEAASAIGMVDAITWVIIGFFNALALGGTVVVAQAWGRGDKEGAERAAAQAMTASIVLALALGGLVSAFASPIVRLLYPSAEPAVTDNAVSYLGITAMGYPFLAAALAASGVLRGAGDTKTPMLVNVSMNIINVAASVILIYGLDLGAAGVRVPALGVSGAATGITIARAFGAAFFILVLARSSRTIRLSSLSRFGLDMGVMRKVFAIGVPSAVENLTFNGGKLLSQTYIVFLGTDAVAANYIASSISGFLQIPASSLSIAATTLVGQAVGKKDSEAARRNLVVVTALGAISLLLGGIPGYPLAEALVGLYTHDAAVVAISAKLLRLLFIVSPIFWAPSFILPSGLRGAGDANFPMVVSMISMWTVRVVLGYVLALPLGLGVLGVWVAMTIDWVVRAAFFGRRLRSGKWLSKAGT